MTASFRPLNGSVSTPLSNWMPSTVKSPNDCLATPTNYFLNVCSLNNRQDTLNQQQIETLQKMSEVMAQVSERARIVQEQVNSQFQTVVNRALGQAERDAQWRGIAISENYRTQIQEMIKQFNYLKKDKGDSQAVQEITVRLNALAAQVAQLPQELESAARDTAQSIVSAGLASNPSELMTEMGMILRNEAKELDHVTLKELAMVSPGVQQMLSRHSAAEIALGLKTLAEHQYLDLLNNGEVPANTGVLGVPFKMNIRPRSNAPGYIRKNGELVRAVDPSMSPPIASE